MDMEHELLTNLNQFKPTIPQNLILKDSFIEYSFVSFIICYYFDLKKKEKKDKDSQQTK